MTEAQGLKIVSILGPVACASTFEILVTGLLAANIDSVPTWLIHPVSTILSVVLGLSLCGFLVVAERKKFRQMYKMTLRWMGWLGASCVLVCALAFSFISYYSR